MGFRIVQGDVLERLREMPEGSVQCVVTSPPYWGLRDYGTGRWVDHDPDCEHVRGDKIANVCVRCGGFYKDDQIGLEPTPAEFLAKMVAVFREVRRVLRADGTCWVNMGDGYAANSSGAAQSGLKALSDKYSPRKTPRQNHAYQDESPFVAKSVPSGFKPKDLIGMPWRLAFALQEDGWWLRQDIIWAKPNPMPESVTDRCTKAHEYIFLLTKSARYFYDAEAVKEASTSEPDIRVAAEDEPSRHGVAGARASGVVRMGGGNVRNKRSVWEIATEAFPEAHFATFPTKLVEPCILAGTSERGCCSSCGAPWERVTEQVDTGRTQKMADGWDTGAGGHGTVHRDGPESGEAGKPVTRTQTVGWKAGCGCGAETVPCAVLDPFNGAGTTGLVAVRLGREYQGIELNPKYVEMATRRIIGDRPLFYAAEVRA